MPYDARYAVMSVRKNFTEIRVVPRVICLVPFGAGLFLCQSMQEKLPVAGSLYMGFSLLRTLEFFVFRKMEMSETIIHLLCGWSQIVIQKNHLSVTIELFSHYCRKER